MAGKKKTEKEDLKKCGECKSVVGQILRKQPSVKYAISCSIVNVKNSTRTHTSYLSKTKFISIAVDATKQWGQILKTILDLRGRKDRLEENFETHKVEIDEVIRDFISTFMEEAKNNNVKVGSLNNSIEEMLTKLMKFEQERSTELKNSLMR